MTSKSLQTPSIIEIIGSTIRVAHPDISGYTRTQLASQIAAAGTTMTVVDNTNFADNDWFIVGSVGDAKTEECDVNGAVTKGTSMTVTNYLSFAHEINAPVTKIYERGIAIYGAATDGGTGTLIASIDAKTASGRQLADAVMIDWHKPYTEYTLITTDTAYNYYYAKFTDGTTSSSASDYVAATGLTSNTVQYFIDQALNLTNTKIDERNLTKEWLIKVANDCQTEITQFKYQDPTSGRFVQMDWDFEATEDSSITASENENKYSLSDLSLKHGYTNKSFINVRFGDSAPIDYMDIQEYDELMNDKPRTELSVEASAGDTTLTVDSNVLFADEGSLYLGDDTVTYTGKSSTTGFTGIPASGTGAITDTRAIDSAVWQGITPDKPTRYTVYEGSILFDYPVYTDYVSYPVFIRYYKKLTALTQSSDTTVVPFTNIFQYYIASKIFEKKGKYGEADRYLLIFNQKLLDNALQNKSPLTDKWEYYDYQDPNNYYLT